MYKEKFGNIPNRDKIKYYLKESNKNLGSRVNHSLLIAKSAENIGKEIGLDPDICYAIGALHDIGKAENNKHAKHIIRGFEILREDSYFFPARIAITHAFTIKDIKSYSGKLNITSREKNIIENFLFQIEYNDYDKLIQLLDSSIKKEYLGIEKRVEKKLKKHEKDLFYDEKLKKLKEIEEYFQKKLSYPIEYYCK